MTRERSALAVALLVIVWFGAALVQVENERHALLLGMCRDPVTSYVSGECLAKAKTRDAWYWHLFYALRR